MPYRIFKDDDQINISKIIYDESMMRQNQGVSKV